MTPYWLGFLTGILATLSASFFTAVGFLALFRREPPRYADTVQTSTRVRWAEDDPRLN